MKKIALIILFVIAFSCKNDKKLYSGHPYEILDEQTYNEVQAIYSNIGDFEDGSSIVKKQNKYGLINHKGKVILDCIYDTIMPVENGHRITVLNSMYGMVDNSGKECIANIYENYWPCKKDGYYLFCKNNKWGFLSDKGEILVQFKYESMDMVSSPQGLDSMHYVGMINGKCGLYSYPEKEIIEPKYDFIMTGDPNAPIIGFLNDKIAIYNSNNELVSDLKYNEYWLSKGQQGKYLIVRKANASTNSYQKYLYGLLNYQTGEEIIPVMYESLGNISEGLMYAELNGKYGYINSNNETIIPFKYNTAEDFSEGLALVSIHGGYFNGTLGRTPYNIYGFIDTLGNYIIKPTFADQSFSKSTGFHEGLAAMGIRPENNMLAQKFGYIDKTGKFVIKPIYEETYSFNNGLAKVKLRNKYGYINRTGDVVIDISYDNNVIAPQKDSVIVLEKNNQKYYFNLDGSPKVD